MGGKTQQRVSGNVKPSSSGRIRDLLNKQHGVGNIITFSALSNSQQQNQPQQEPHQEPPKPRVGKAAAESTPPDETSQTNPPKARPSLVLKRIGNRDFFTRVATANQTDTPVGTKKGVFKIPEEFGGSTTKESNQIDSNTSLNDGPIESDSIERKEEEHHDFDEIINKIAQLKEEISTLADDSKKDPSRELAEKECELIDSLRILMQHFKHELSLEELDLITASIQRWLELTSSICNQAPQESVFTQILKNALDFIKQMISEGRRLALIGADKIESEYPMARLLLEDYQNFHSSPAYRSIFILYLELISCQISSSDDDWTSILEAAADIIVNTNSKQIISCGQIASNYLDTKIEFDPEFKLPADARYCGVDESKFGEFLAVCSLLRSNDRVKLVPAHVILAQCMDMICENLDLSTIISEQDDLDSAFILPPASLTAILTSRDSMVSALLSDYRVGDISVTIEPNTDAYGCTLAYLFTWDLVIQFIVGIDKELGHRIIHNLKKLGLIRRLLDNIFMLLPPLGERDSLNLKMPKDNLDDKSISETWTLKDFLKSALVTSIQRLDNEIELAALHVYFSVARHMPVTVRKWFNNNSNKRLCNLVNEYTVKHVSQVICSLEMEAVQEKCQDRASKDESNNLVIKARPSAKEVYAIYTRDEFKMELTIKLPINYPLGPVQIDGGKRVGVTDLKWRSWLLQLTTFLSHQNGPILDGIDLWRKNIDKRFEGIEKCTICFSILHSNYQLPKKKCMTCTKMFHSLCLYKWFESSGNSTCPLCRNPW